MNPAAFLRRLLGDRSGAAIVELGIAAPILALLVVGIADVSNAFSRKLALEQAAQRAMEKIMQTTGTLPPDDTLKAEAVSQAGGGLVVGDVAIVYTLYCVDSAGAFTAQSNYITGSCSGGATEARYLEVRVTDEYEPIFPLPIPGANAEGRYPVKATAGMRIQ